MKDLFSFPFVCCELDRPSTQQRVWLIATLSLDGLSWSETINRRETQNESHLRLWHSHADIENDYSLSVFLSHPKQILVSKRSTSCRQQRDTMYIQTTTHSGYQKYAFPQCRIGPPLLFMSLGCQNLQKKWDKSLSLRMTAWLWHSVREGVWRRDGKCDRETSLQWGSQ